MQQINFLGQRCLLFVLYGLLTMSLADFRDEMEDDDEAIFILKSDLTPKTEKPKENEIDVLTRYHEECINITNVDESRVERLNKGFWSVQDRSVKEWAFCVLIKLGIMTEEAVFRVDVAMSRIPECDKDTAEMIINKCLSKKEKPPLETAWMYLQCLSARDPKRNLSLGVFPRTTTDRYKWT